MKTKLMFLFFNHVLVSSTLTFVSLVLLISAMLLWVLSQIFCPWKLLMWKACVGTEMSFKHQWVCWKRKEIYMIQLIKYKLGMFKRKNKLVFLLKLYVWYISYVSCSTSLKYRFDKLVCTGTKEILMSSKLKTFRNKLSWFSHKYEPDTLYLFSCLPSLWAIFW